MKLRNLVFISIIALLMLSVCPLQAANRLVVAEAFTQWNCGPCAGWNPTEYSVLQAMTRDTVIAIKYHVWWPSPNNDQFYLWNTGEVTSRVNYYGVSGVPDGFIDGRTEITRSQSGFRSQVRSRALVQAPCEIEMYATISGETQVQFSGTITATDSALTNTRLFVTLITDRIQYSSPPGSNGETMFYDIFRDMYPNANGETISVPLGDTYDFEGTLNKDASWPSDGMSVVCWIQDYSSKWVHQAAWVPVLNQWAVRTNSEDERQAIIGTRDEVNYYIELENLGSQDDEYTVSLPGSLPSGWTQTIEATDIPADPNSIQVPLASGESTWLILTARPNGNGGNTMLTVDVQSNNNENTHAEESFHLMAGLDILLVDDDGGSVWGNYESYYEDALYSASGSRVFGSWDREIGTLDGLDLSTIHMVIWFTGSNPQGNTLDAQELNMLEIYLDGGGKLFLTGQGIAWDLRTSSFLSDYLHCDHVQPYAQGRNIVGVSGDPLGNDMTFDIYMSGGAQNQTRQSAIAPHDEMSSVSFEYSGSDFHAGLSIDDGNYRAIFLGFGFEAISNSGTRNALMDRAITWLLGPSAVDPTVDLSLPTEFAIEQNYPNPFNPETTIPYMLPERAEVSLRVFDMLGREVATLASGTHDAGVYTARWNAANVSSGIYFYRLDASSGTNEFHSTRKLVLMK